MQNIEIRTFCVCTTNEHIREINWNHPLAVYFASFIANRSNWRVKGEIDYVRWKNHWTLKNDGYRCVQRNGDRYHAWSPKIRQSPSFASISPSNRRFNVGGHPKHLFICTWFVCRTLPRFPLLGFNERVVRWKGGKEGRERRTPEGWERDAGHCKRWDSRESRWGCKIHERDSKPVITVRTSRPLWWSTFTRGGEWRENRAELGKSSR